MANLENIKIHTMQDDLPAASSASLPAGRQGISAKGAIGRPAAKSGQLSSSNSRPNRFSSFSSPSFPIPARPAKDNLYLPAKSEKAQNHAARWFIIGAAVLIILNFVIWSIAIIS